MERDLRTRRPFARYVAIGDGLTEGIGDPDGLGGHRGWADRLAELLDAADPGLRYANLAVRGRGAEHVHTVQLDAALALYPDLVTVTVGLRDVLRTRPDHAALLADIDDIFGSLVESGATVLSFTCPDIGAVAPLTRPFSARVYALNDGLRYLAGEHGVVLIDLETLEVAADPAIWAEDRLHPNPLGHDLLARAAAEALALPGADDSWRDPLPAGRPRSFPDELTWVTRHLIPWTLGRPLGRGGEPKRPDLLPLLT